MQFTSSEFNAKFGSEFSSMQAILHFKFESDWIVTAKRFKGIFYLNKTHTENEAIEKEIVK